tara:strand:- start:458 stop:988 length:531 start_codon:yes stop_codon:yes gene_type:complete
MATDIKDILQNVKDIYMTDSSLNTLLNFERVIDELGLYAFANWQKGELVAGPVYEKYFVTCTFMWPYKMMPDPSGAERLLNYDCEVIYKKDTLTYPAKVKDQSDFLPGTHVAKPKQRKIWLVSITMPKNLLTEISRGSLELENDTLDMDDIETAYEEGDDEMANRTQDEQEEFNAQ